MPESLLTILKFLLLALLYLFFLRVLRAVWAEVRSPAPTAARTTAVAGAGPGPGTGGNAPTVVTSRPGRGDRGTTTKLKVVEPAPAKGQTFEISDESKVGRSATCDIRLDDTYASQLHARIFRQDGQVFIEDSGSTNGTYLTRKGTQHREKVAGPMPLRPGDLLYIGKTVLEACAK